MLAHTSRRLQSASKATVGSDACTSYNEGTLQRAARLDDWTCNQSSPDVLYPSKSVESENFGVKPAGIVPCTRRLSTQECILLP